MSNEGTTAAIIRSTGRRFQLMRLALFKLLSPFPIFWPHFFMSTPFNHEDKNKMPAFHFYMDLSSCRKYAFRCKLQTSTGMNTVILCGGPYVPVKVQRERTDLPRKLYIFISSGMLGTSKLNI